jgi:hypothetical protein
VGRPRNRKPGLRHLDVPVALGVESHGLWRLLVFAMKLVDPQVLLEVRETSSVSGVNGYHDRA